MDEDFFNDQAETVAITSSNTQNPSSNTFNFEPQEDEFEFESIHMNELGSNNYIPPVNENSWPIQSQEEDETAKRIREEEERVLEKLREKAVHLM